MTGNDILHSTSVSPQVLYSQQLSTTDVALYTVPSNQSARLFQGTVCNSSSGQVAPTLTLSNVYTQISAPAITLGTTSGSGGTFSAATYFWVVTATTPVGETTVSNEITHAIAANGTQIINWGVVGSANGYKIYRGTSTGAENVLVTTIGSGGTTTYLDTGTSSGAASPPGANTSGGGSSTAGTYFWVMTAVSSAGETTASNEVTAAVSTNGSVVFTWTAVAAATTYRIYRGTATNTENKLVATISAPTTTGTDTGVAGTTQTPVTTSTFAVAVSLYLSITKSGGALDSTHRIINNQAIAVDDTLSLKDYVNGTMLGPGDYIAGKASVAGALVVVLTGTVHV